MIGLLRFGPSERLGTLFHTDLLVRILPQLHDLPGVIWLVSEREIILLTSELKKEIEDVIGINSSEPEAKEESARTRDDLPKVTAEILALYAVLELPPFAPLPEVKRSYRRLVKIYHPDARPSSRKTKQQNSDDKIKEINVAYHEILRHSTTPPNS